VGGAQAISSALWGKTGKLGGRGMGALCGESYAVLSVLSPLLTSVRGRRNSRFLNHSYSLTIGELLSQRRILSIAGLLCP